MDISELRIKRNLAKCFNRAAASYAHVASLQKHVGLALLKNAQPHLSEVNVLADIGAGTGMLTPFLEEAFPESIHFFIDLAEETLFLNQQNFCNSFSVCADFDRLPFKDRQFDFIFSNMCLQWSLNLEKTLVELCRSLESQGVIAVAFLTKGTLKELENNFLSQFNQSPVNSFYQHDAVLQIVERYPLLILEGYQKRHVERYESLNDLIKYLKMIGANYSIKRSKRGMTPSQWKKIVDHYHSHYSIGNQIISTFNVTYLILKKLT